MQWKPPNASTSTSSSRQGSASSTPRLTPAVSAMHSAFASPTAPLSRAASPAILTLPTRRQSTFEVEDDAFAAATEDPHEVALGSTPDQSTPFVEPPPPSAPVVEPASFAPATAPGPNGTTSTLPGGSLSHRLGETIVISGGSGYNDLLGATPGNTTYVLPISDNGGSSSEIIRTLSGPSIGDLRSRLVRLIPLTTSPRLPGRPVPPASNDALHALLSYRLPTTGRTRDIRSEWLDILEGKHKLWRGIEADRREVVRGMLVHFESEILRRAHRNFNLRGLSVGNAFLSAAQKFFRSIQSAIFLFSATTLVAGSGSSVLPCINTNHTATIAAELEDGSTIVGQCEISHPARPKHQHQQQPPQQHHQLTVPPSGLHTPSSGIFDPLANLGSDLGAASTRSRVDQSHRWQEDRVGAGRKTVGTLQDGLEPDDDDEATSQSGAQDQGDDFDDDEGSEGETSAATGAGNIVFSKDSGEEVPLPSRIKNVVYINSYRNVVWPAPNMSYLASLSRCRSLIYSCGSLYTSLVPSLALRGVATSIAQSPSLRYKILLLNTTNDRETPGYTAVDFIQAIANALNMSDRPHDAAVDGSHGYPPREFITHIVYYPQGQVVLDRQAVEAMGIQCIAIHTDTAATAKKPPRFTEDELRGALDRIVGDAPQYEAQLPGSRRSSNAGIAAPVAGEAGARSPSASSTSSRQRMEGFTYLTLN